MSYSKELLQETLENILQALEADEVERHDSYSELFLEEFTDKLYESGIDEERPSFENILAVEAVKYPELHPLMEKIVLCITEIGERGRHTEIWENEEEQAGGSLARELAMYDKKFLPLQLRYIFTNDMDHEVYQTDDIIAVCDKWDYSKEVYPLLIFRAELGQVTEAFEGLAKGILKKAEDAQGYLDEAIGYFKQFWSFTAHDSDDIEQIQTFFSPVFGEFYGLDEAEMKAFATEFVNRMAAENEPTVEELLQAAKNK